MRPLKTPKTVGATLMAVATVLSVAACEPAGGGAGSYPNRPVEIVINYPAGGSTDTVGRTLVDVINKKDLLPERVQLVNRDGGAGTTGITEVVRSNPDGYTVGFTTSGAVTVQPLVSEAPFKPADIDLVQQVALNNVIVAVPSDSPYKSIEDLVAAAEKDPSKVNVGEGPASYEFALSALEQEAGIKTNRIDFEGDAPMAKSLLGGDIDAAVIGAGGVLSQIKSGDVRALSVLSDKRSPFLPEVPTTKESNLDVAANVYFWLYGPLDLPADIRKVIGKAFKRAAETSAFESQTEKLGVEVSIAPSEKAEATAEGIRDSAKDVVK